MARRANKPKETPASKTKPKFPYTNKPGILRKFLKEIPKRPKPPKFDMDMLRTWGFRDTNDYTILRVLKAVRLLNEKNEPTDFYSRFMDMTDGARALGPEIERVYEPLFQASHEPYNEGNEKLRNWFNIHSGGGESVLEMQIQTFKALAENAMFGDRDAVAPKTSAIAAQTRVAGATQVHAPEAGPAIHIDLHIHLPENKSRRDYEDIIESIGRHIFGRQKNGDE
jgi:Family of unknown function (DUF5343)